MTDLSRRIHRHKLQGFLRDFLNPQLWKRVHEVSAPFNSKRSRWKAKPVCFVGLCMALDVPSISMTERFEYAREVYHAVFPKRRRCGETLQGFLDALKLFPLEVLKVFQEELEKVLIRASIQPFSCGRWDAAGVDGSKQNLPRTLANEAHYDSSGKGLGVPQRLLVNVVAMQSELLVEWASGKFKEGERGIALKAISSLPKETLIVADAGFHGYDWICSVLGQQKHVLVRVGANVNLWAERVGAIRKKGGEVWLWPSTKKDQAPLRLRLIRISRRVKAKRRGTNSGGRRRPRVKKETMYLLTDVLAEKKLTRREAGDLYGKRWPANEGMFRNWKRTMNCDVARGRTPAIAEREFHFSMLAYMSVQAMVLLARKQRRQPGGRVSIAKVLKVWRKALKALLQGKTTRWFAQCLSACVVDKNERKGPKAKRAWPRRRKYEPLKTPNIRKLTVAKKAEGLRLIEDKVA